MQRGGGRGTHADVGIRRIGGGVVRVTVNEDGALTYTLERALRRREGRYLLRTNLRADDSVLVWRCHLQLDVVEEAFWS
jgi:hypothetical protein